MLLLCLSLFGAPIAGVCEAAATPVPSVMSMIFVTDYPPPDVPEGPRVDDSYFKGAIIVGDSTTDPFALYGVVPELMVAAVIGISPRTAYSDQLFHWEGKKVDLATLLGNYNPPVVYLWLGSNGVDTKPADQVLEDYERLMNKLIKRLPGTIFYLVSLAPVKLLAQEKYKNYTNERVDEFNEGLRELAWRHNVYYLHINPLLRNENGLLDAEYGAGDGIHLREPAYRILADYMYTHAVPIDREWEETP